MASATVIPDSTPKGTFTGGMEQDVGMIAAIVNPRHNEIHGDDIGFFGLFECVNSQQVANVLLDVAAACGASEAARPCVGRSASP